MRLLVSLATLALAAGPAWSDQDQQRKAWRELFAQSQPAVSPAHIQAVLSACEGKVEAVKALIADDSAYEDFPPGWLRRTTSIEAPKVVQGPSGPVPNPAGRYDVEFFVRLPTGYSPKKSWPMLLAGHGQEGDGKEIGMLMQELLGKAKEEYIILAPTMPGPKAFSGKPYQEQACLKPLDWARQHLNVDDDRVFVAGYSQGGHLAWHLAVVYPRLFAAAVPMAGVPWFEGSPYINDSYLANALDLPLWAIWGEKDKRDPNSMGTVDFSRLADRKMRELKAKKFTGTELPGVGHGGCFPRPEAFVRYLAAGKRQAAPEKFTHNFHLAHHRRGYYVEAGRLLHAAIDFDKPSSVEIKVEPGKQPSDLEVLRAVQYRLEKVMFELSAELDRKGNGLTIRARGIGAVRIYVMEGMFDLAGPVGLRFGGKSWRGSIPASASCLLQHYAQTRDAGNLVRNEVDIDETAKATVRFAKE